MTLADTVELMQSSDHNEQFKAEYQQTKIRYEEQERYMLEYLRVLETRALLEGIEFD